MQTKYEVLVLEDSETDFSILRAKLARVEGDTQFVLTRAGDLCDFITVAGGHHYDAAIVDLHVPDSVGLDTYVAVRRHIGPDVPIVVLTGCEGESTGVTAIRSGAEDFLEKDGIDGQQLARTLLFARERRALLQELKVTQRELYEQRQLENLGKLAGGIAHEVNNKLAVIQGFAQNLRESLQDEAGQAAIRHILESCNNVGELVEKLLTIGARDDSIVKQLDLARLIHRTESLLQERSGDANLEFDLPASGLWIKANELHIHQLLLNLIQNATDAGAKQICIKAGPPMNPENQLGGPVVLQIIDDGCGIGEASFADLANPFESSWSGNHEGLGLSIVQGIARKHGFSCAAENRPEHGAVFSVVMPRHFPATRPVLARRKTRRTQLPMTGFKVLVVEDETAIRKLLINLLNRNGYETEEAEDGDIGLAKLLSEPTIDLVLSDVRMPRMSGPEMLNQVKEARPDLPAVFLTGYSEGILAREGWLESDTPVLKKPFKTEELLQSIRDQLVVESI